MNAPGVTVVDGIATRYQVIGAGPPLLMFAPGGFDATIEKWWTQGTYAHTRMMELLTQRFTCIVFDRRECGQSGGRVEPLTWQSYARQGMELLKLLGIQRAHVMGGCMGVCPVLAMAKEHTAAIISMMLWWPVGGARYRINATTKFAEHLSFVKAQGLRSVVEMSTQSNKPFGSEPRGGPWASVIQHDASFAAQFASQSTSDYMDVIRSSASNLFDRDTVPGADPETLFDMNIPALVVPGHDVSHATSAARYLEECLPAAQYWDASVEEQTPAAAWDQIERFISTLPSN